jgi:hypothetical protein
MYKVKRWVPVLAGLMIGQLFADSERPFKVANTVRVGYSDNLYRNENKEADFFVTDMIDLSFRAALSDRTDVMMKSQLTLLNDRGGSDIYPNLYLMLNHSISPRLLLSLSEYYRSGEKSGGDANVPGRNKRYDYFYNNVAGSADYVLTGKDRLIGSLNYAVLRHDQEIDTLDYTMIGGGLTWKRELAPQRTFTTLNLRHRRVTYDNQPEDTATRLHLEDDAYFDATDLSAGLNHTFNQQWQGNVEAGVTYVQPHFSDANDTSQTPSFDKAENDPTFNPLLKAGLVYSPSPRTRLTGDFSLSHKASDDDGYGGQNTAELSLGAQHDLTAKLMAKATARFANTQYDEEDATTGTPTDETEDRMDLEFRLTYKLNRIHFLEAGVAHRETERDNGISWEENRVDIGWRVELN